MTQIDGNSSKLRVIQNQKFQFKQKTLSNDEQNLIKFDDKFPIFYLFMLNKPKQELIQKINKIYNEINLKLKLQFKQIKWAQINLQTFLKLLKNKNQRFRIITDTYNIQNLKTLVEISEWQRAPIQKIHVLKLQEYYAEKVIKLKSQLKTDILQLAPDTDQMILKVQQQMKAFFEHQQNFPNDIKLKKTKAAQYVKFCGIYQYQQLIARLAIISALTMVESEIKQNIELFSGYAKDIIKNQEKLKKQGKLQILQQNKVAFKQKLKYLEYYVNNSNRLQYFKLQKDLTPKMIKQHKQSKKLFQKQYLNQSMKRISQNYIKQQQQQDREQNQSSRLHESLNKLKKFYKSIITLYMGQTGFSQIINYGLKVLKKPTLIKKILVPVKQLYEAIKFEYNYYTEEQDKIKTLLYRGTFLSQTQLNSLRQGIFIEFFGFLSSSEDKNVAIDFLKNFKKSNKNLVLLVIDVLNYKVLKRYKPYDHGYSRVGKRTQFIQQKLLQISRYLSQKEVLFNPLNIFKITKIKPQKQNDLKYTCIYLKYGQIYELHDKYLRKKLSQNSQIKVAKVFDKYMKQHQQIKNTGDFLRFSNQTWELINYYQKRIKSEPNNIDLLLGLVQAQIIQKDNQNATKNLQIVDKLLKEQKYELNKESIKKFFDYHYLKTEILRKEGKYEQAEKSYTQAIQKFQKHQKKQQEKKDKQNKKIQKYQEEQNDMEDSQVLTMKEQKQSLALKIGKTYFSRGKIRMINGQMRPAILDYQRALQMYKDEYLRLNGGPIQGTIKKFCTNLIKKFKSESAQLQINKNQQIQQQIFQISCQISRVYNTRQHISIYARDLDQYQSNIKKAKQLFDFMNFRQEDKQDPIKNAQYTAFRLRVEQNVKLIESQQTVKNAISLLQENNFKYSPEIAQLSQMLARKQSQEIDKPNSQYNRTKVYNNCLKNYKRAIDILEFNNPQKNSQQIMYIKRSMMDLQFRQEDFSSCSAMVDKIISTTPINQNQINNSKFYLMKAKIAITYGQFKKAFNNCSNSISLIQRVYKDNQKGEISQEKLNEKLYFNQDYLESKMILQKINLLRGQFKDAEKQIQKIKNGLKLKFGKSYENHDFYADCLELEIYIYKGINKLSKEQQFEQINKKWEKVLDIRSSTIAEFKSVKYMLSLSNFVKHLFHSTKHIKYCIKKYKECIQLYASLSKDHPHFWVYHFLKAIQYDYNGYPNKALSQFQDAISLFQGKLKRQNFKILKSQTRLIRLKIYCGKCIMRTQKNHEITINYFKRLKQQTEQSIDLSSKNDNDSETYNDDQKIQIKWIICQKIIQAMKLPSDQKLQQMRKERQQLKKTILSDQLNFKFKNQKDK